MTSVLQLRPIRFAAGAPVFIVALGLIVLVGWFSHIPTLVQVLPQLPPVRRNAAACFVFCGLAMLAVARRWPRWVIVTCTGIVSAVSILTLVEYALNLNLGIDEILGPAYINPGLNSARMPAVSAICFLSSAMALLLVFRAQSKQSGLVAVVVGSIVTAVGLATIMAYALGSSDVYGWDHVTRAPLLTAVGVLVLGLGMLALAWHVDPDPAGIPRWLPVSVAIGVATSAISLWQGFIADGHAPFALLPAVVLGGGCLMATMLGLTAYLAQRAHTQAAALRPSEAARSELARVARITTLGALTASIAHEVNQPLTGILTNASTCQRMLSADPPNVEGALETVRRTIRDIHRASAIITKLRALYSKKETTPEPVDLNEAAREVIALFLLELQSNHVVLRTEFALDLPPVKGDRVQLQQVVLNLLRNAADALNRVEDRPRELLVRTERDDRHGVRLSVQDAGTGFEPDAADKLFGAFYTTKQDGMGMGLSVSRSIIESHHGRLWATRNDGPGATFSFSIPSDPKTPVRDRYQSIMDGARGRSSLREGIGHDSR